MPFQHFIYNVKGTGINYKIASFIQKDLRIKERFTFSVLSNLELFKFTLLQLITDVWLCKIILIALSNLSNIYQ